MAKVPLEAIKVLREKTGASIGAVKSALETAKGDEAKAIGILREKGFETARQRADRSTRQGRVESYVHHDGRVGTIVEVSCETDFVARLPEFQRFCKDLAMQVAATHPTCLSKEDLSSAQREEAKRMGKSAEELAREVCLLEQPLIKDQGQTVAQLLASLIAKTGENIVVKRFARFTVGESP